MRYALVFLLLAGCASEGSHDYVQSEARGVQSVDFGTVQSVRAVKIKADSAVVGTVAGAAIGGLLGDQVGHGGGRAAATVIGGSAAASPATRSSADRRAGRPGVVIPLDSGATVAIVQPGPHALAAGDRVRVLTGPKGSRVERG